MARNSVAHNEVALTGGGMTQITALRQERQYVASRAESPPGVRRVPLRTVQSKAVERR